MNGKRGIIAYESVMTIIRTLMLVFTLISLVLVANVFIVRSVDTRFAESYTLKNILYYSENGLAHKDSSTGRVYSGSVDSSHPMELKSVFDYNEDKLGPFIAAKVTFAGSKAAFYYQQDIFNDWNFLYRAGVTKGVGGINKVSSLVKMPVYEGQDVRTAEVKVEVVSRNE